MIRMQAAILPFHLVLEEMMVIFMAWVELPTSSVQRPIVLETSIQKNLGLEILWVTLLDP